MLRFASSLLVGFVIGFGGAFSAEGPSEGHRPDPGMAVSTGLGMAGKMLPAIGFAMILNVMAKKELIPFVLLGYIAIAYYEAACHGRSRCWEPPLRCWCSFIRRQEGSEDSVEEVEVEFEDGI